MIELAERPIFSGVWIIALSEQNGGQLDIYSSTQLAQPYYTRHPLTIVGLAGSKDEAIHVIEQIVAECLAARGDCSLKEYLAC